jgi:predicted nuclease of predicted toxin-antitoxin system
MRFLVDECTGPAVAAWLRSRGDDVFSVFDDARGMTDEWIIEKAASEKRVLITNDKDFGERVYRDGRVHAGVVLLRLADERASCKIGVLRRLLQAYESRLPQTFTVVTEERVRFARE